MALPSNLVCVFRVSAADEPAGDPLWEFLGQRCKAADSAADSAVPEGCERRTLEIDTKYYRASLEVWVATVVPEAKDSSTVDGDDPEIDEKGAADALPIISHPLLDAANSCGAVFVSAGSGGDLGWNHVKALLRGVARADDGGPALRATTIHSDKLVSARTRELCFDLEAEIVHSKPVDAAGEDDEWSGRDLFGSDRLVEMLETHMWPDLEMKSAPGSRPLAEKPAGSGQSSAKSGSGLPDMSHLGELLRASMLEADPDGDPFNDDEDNEELDSFAKALGELQHMRSVAADLPDEDRHELASRVALSMMKFMDDASDSDDA